jgi:hypothetical protein
VLFGDAVLASESEPELVGRGASSFAFGRENKLLLRDALLMTSGEVKRLFDCAARLSGFGPALSAPSRSILMLRYRRRVDRSSEVCLGSQMGLTKPDALHCRAVAN